MCASTPSIAGTSPTRSRSPARTTCARAWPAASRTTAGPWSTRPRKSPGPGELNSGAATIIFVYEAAVGWGQTDLNPIVAMSPASARPTQSAFAAAAQTRSRKLGRPFLGLIDSVVVESPAEFEFDGAITRGEGMAVWTWVMRDLAADLIDPEVRDDDPIAAQALEALM